MNVYIKNILFLILFLIISLSISSLSQRPDLRIEFDNYSDTNDIIQVFWDTGEGYNEKESIRKSIIDKGKNEFRFKFPAFSYPNKIRIDIFSNQGKKFKLERIYLRHKKNNFYEYSLNNLKTNNLEFINDKFVSSTNDPMIFLESVPNPFKLFSKYFFSSFFILILFSLFYKFTNKYYIEFFKSKEFIISLIFIFLILYLFNSFPVFNGLHFNDTHSLTALSLINGHFVLPIDPAVVIPNDLQLSNGALFSMHGFAVPFLQTPFHLLSIFFFKKLFPESIIFIAYYFLTVLTVNYYLSKKQLLNQNYVFLISNLLLFSFLIPLLAYRFLIYEHTVAYTVLLSFCAIFITFSLVDNFFKNEVKAYFLLSLIFLMMVHTRPVLAILVIFLSLYLLIFKKGCFLYLMVFGFLSLCILFSLNFIKSGNLFSFGLNNSFPGIPNELFALKLSDPCYLGSFDYRRIFDFFLALFVGIKEITNECITIFEYKNRSVISGYGELIHPEILPYNAYIPFNVQILFLIPFFYCLTRAKQPMSKFILYSFPISISALFLIYSFFANGFAPRYIYDYLILCIPTLILFLKFLKKDLTLFYCIFLIFISFFIFINNNYREQSSIKIDGINKNVRWENNQLSPSIREANSNKLHQYDLFNWDKNGSVKMGHMHFFISVPIIKNDYIFDIKGKNLPSYINAVINGKKEKIYLSDPSFKISLLYGKTISIIFYGLSEDVIINSVEIK